MRSQDPPDDEHEHRCRSTAAGACVERSCSAAAPFHDRTKTERQPPAATAPQVQLGKGRQRRLAPLVIATRKPTGRRRPRLATCRPWSLRGKAAPPPRPCIIARSPAHHGMPDMAGGCASTRMRRGAARTRRERACAARARGFWRAGPGAIVYEAARSGSNSGGLV
jgi:hypothetical protein